MTAFEITRKKTRGSVASYEGRFLKNSKLKTATLAVMVGVALAAGSANAADLRMSKQIGGWQDNGDGTFNITIVQRIQNFDTAVEDNPDTVDVDESLIGQAVGVQVVDSIGADLADLNVSLVSGPSNSPFSETDPHWVDDPDDPDDEPGLIPSRNLSGNLQGNFLTSGVIMSGATLNAEEYSAFSYTLRIEIPQTLAVSYATQSEIFEDHDDDPATDLVSRDLSNNSNTPEGADHNRKTTLVLPHYDNAGYESACGAAGDESATNLVSNGDFAMRAGTVGGIIPPNDPIIGSTGNVGFTSAAAYIGDGNITAASDAEGAYGAEISIHAGTALTQGIQQHPFPGDADRGVARLNNWLMMSGNKTENPNFVDVWKQTVPVTGGMTYNFTAYVSNANLPDFATGTTADPIVQLLADGEALLEETSVVVEGSPVYGKVLVMEKDGIEETDTNFGVDEDLTDNTVVRGDTWFLVQGTFTAAQDQTEVELTIRNNREDSIVHNSRGNVLALTGVGLHVCGDDTEDDSNESADDNTGGNTTDSTSGGSNTEDDTDVAGDSNADDSNAQDDANTGTDGNNGSEEESASSGGGGGGSTGLGLFIMGLISLLGSARRRLQSS